MAINSTFNTKDLTPIETVFQDADNSQASFATRLYDLKIFDKAQAMPHIIKFIEKKYEGAKAYMGQRGMTFTKDTAEHQAMKRIIANCFETAPKANTQNKTEPKDPPCCFDCKD